VQTSCDLRVRDLGLGCDGDTGAGRVVMLVRVDVRVPASTGMGAEASEFDAYVRARGRGLLRFAFLLCHDDHLAQDLVQEALVKAHRRWSRIDSPDAYVRQIIVRDLCSWKRRKAATEWVTDRVPEPPGVTPAGPEDRTAMWALLGELPRQQRAVLVLRFYEGLADEQIALALGCSQATVRSHASKALSHLRANGAAQRFLEGTA
jgi:RNA polymerase sigma-70 factor (sigma-E family)